jgi:hypothetical protein
MQRAPRLAARKGGVGLARPRERAVRVERADRVQRGVVARDAREIELDDLGRRDAARADRPGELAGAGERVDALV